ncbi:MAG: right-handed parallel beta-helix repeat-containing protein [Cyanobacteria bacterium SID2]|nr:right-handed parallel beta-helix repeat-containing protein [Cyanobacteria bacterium SID2]MBP0003336.1 right-handed parallel beta-helix repeat-containing protein [Cyanobacteria bacterium SBC]
MAQFDQLIGKPSRRQVLRWGVAATVAAMAFETRSRVAAREDETPEIYVSTAEAFVEAIGSNRTIVVNPGSYDLTNLDRSDASEFVSFESVHDGEQLNISGVENLTILGLGDRSPRLLARPRYANVLTFLNSRNVTLQNLELGHFPDRGTCSGSVLYFSGCRDITIADHHLFGSGAWGLFVRNTENLNVRNSIVRHCTYGIAEFYGVRNLRLEDCWFSYNQQFSTIYVSESQNIEFLRCEFNDNVVESYRNYFFELQDSTGLKISDCHFEHNQAQNFASDLDSIELTNNTFDKNTFTDI